MNDLTLIARIDGKTITFDHLLSTPARRRVADGYVLELRRDALLHVALTRQDGSEMDVDHLDIRLRTPLRNFSRIILPDSGREFVFKDRALFLRSAPSGVSAPNDGFPFLAFVDQTGGVSTSFGLVSYLRECTCKCIEPRISARKALLGGANEVIYSFRFPTEGWRYGRTPRVEETLFLGGRFPSWFHALRRYTAHCAAAHKVDIPRNPRAWDATWCTWTAWCSDLMNTRTVLDNARVARDIGVKSIILDDGWFGPGLDTDDRPLNIGDYYPDPAKFDDLPALIRELQAMGLRALLWYAPTCISPDSRAFACWQEHVIMRGKDRVMAPNGFYNLCPCNPQVRAYVRDEIRRMLVDYGADGFKVDLYNTLPTTRCDNPHAHDFDSAIEGMRQMMKDIWGVVREVRPEALLELKQNYGNIIGAQYGTMVRAGDTAYDVDTNLERCAYLQTYAPIVHNDYLACSLHDTPRDLGIMMIKMIAAGVPTFSPDLARQPARTVKVLKAWMSYYTRQLPLLMNPREPQDAALEVWQMGTRAEPIIAPVFQAADIRIPPGARRVWLLNGTGRESFIVHTSRPVKGAAESFDPQFRTQGRRTLTLREGDLVNVPSGGSLCIEIRPAR